MTDGANLGVSARRALGTILGEKPQPSDEDRVSMKELEARIRSRPLPGEGTPPWKDEDTSDAYSKAAEILAHAYLVLADEDPDLLTKGMWDAFTARWPDGDDWIGGVSGFMEGWAFNAARSIKQLPPTPNPAIIEIGEKANGAA